MTLVSFIIPTLNASKVLGLCLRSIFKQTLRDYEIIIADGDSTDNTILKIKELTNSLEIKNLKLKIISNPLKTAEAGKAVALKHARGKYVALIDSDNILPSKNWLQKMLLPFTDPDIICSEPIRFTYRRSGGFIERYSALIGANDPYAWFNGVYDRYSYLTNKWTDLDLRQIDNPKYIKIILDPHKILPTIGANGTIFRANFLNKNFTGDYFFDTDILSTAKESISVAKVKVGIIHTYCESSIPKFIRKQYRRVCDLYSYQRLRHYNWNQEIKLPSLIKSNLAFALYSLTVIPSLLDSLRGYSQKRDPAWFFHPTACLLSFFIYTFATISYLLGFHHPVDRQQWHQ